MKVNTRGPSQIFRQTGVSVVFLYRLATHWPTQAKIVEVQPGLVTNWRCTGYLTSLAYLQAWGHRPIGTLPLLDAFFPGLRAHALPWNHWCSVWFIYIQRERQIHNLTTHVCQRLISTKCSICIRHIYGCQHIYLLPQITSSTFLLHFSSFPTVERIEPNQED